MSKSTSRRVWSSETGDRRKDQSRPASAPPPPAPRRQVVALHRDSKGRAGKGVTVLRGLVLAEADMAALATALKQALGVGGTVKHGVIEIQTHDREKVAAVLLKLGYPAKLAGG